MMKEFCTENYTNIPAAIANGANRIELCDNLAVGGTTPSTGVIEESLTYAGEKGIPVMTMIRPRGGDFIYNDIELRIMHTDLIEAKKLGVDGVVFGCLTPNNWIDEEAVEMLIENAEGLQTTFHMAFDQIDKDRQYEAIDWLVEHGIDNILTHGGNDQTTKVEENIGHLNKLIEYAKGRITIIVGGGVTYENIDQLASKVKTTDFHGTNIVSLG